VRKREPPRASEHSFCKAEEVLSRKIELQSITNLNVVHRQPWTQAPTGRCSSNCRHCLFAVPRWAKSRRIEDAFPSTKVEAIQWKCTEHKHNGLCRRWSVAELLECSGSRESARICSRLKECILVLGFERPCQHHHVGGRLSYSPLLCIATARCWIPFGRFAPISTEYMQLVDMRECSCDASRY
jgi:hypothetical protein